MDKKKKTKKTRKKKKKIKSPANLAQRPSHKQTNGRQGKTTCTRAAAGVLGFFATEDTLRARRAAVLAR
jgi:hypothetical protein